jgi:putative Holliday junction resolvase
MATLIAIDVGTVRVGSAFADDKVGIPFPIAIWPRAKGEAERELLKTLRERRPSKLIVGLPLGPSGERTAICDNIESFVRRILRREPVEVVYVDEAFSSIDARERAYTLPSGSPVDSIAACLILERYLEGGR